MRRVTTEGTNTTLYLNGTNAGSSYLPFNTPDGSQLFIGGIDGPNTIRQTIGLIDEVSIYNRALSQLEIQLIYLVGHRGKCVTSVPLTIISQPANQTVFVGQTASFDVLLTNSLPLNFQWYFNSNAIAGATNATLTLTNIQFSQAGVYTVTVSDSSNFVISSIATLTVNDKLDHFMWSPIPSPQFVNLPFAVVIRAVNVTNGTFTNFTGTIVLSSTNGIVINPPASAVFTRGCGPVRSPFSTLSPIWRCGLMLKRVNRVALT